MKNVIIIAAIVVLVAGVAFWRNRCPCEVVEAGNAATADAAPMTADSPKPVVAEVIRPLVPPVHNDAPVAPGALCAEPPPAAAAPAPTTQAAPQPGPSEPAVAEAEAQAAGAGTAEATPTAAVTPSATEGAKLPRVVDLGADKCKACKQLAPILAELKKEYAGRVEVEFIDVWKNRGAGAPYKIRVIPTQVFFDREGKEIWRHEGFLPKAEFIAKFAELGVK